MTGFKDSIVGGVGNLIRDWIQSVPFVSGSQGWRISKNGNAEFNSVAIRGGVVITNGSQMFVYSSNPPANGTLVFSISPTSGTDAYSNNYVAGFANYGNSTIEIVNGTFAITTSFGDILQLQWDTINFVLSLNDAIPLNFVVSQLMAHLGVDGFNISAGSINAVKPGTGTSFINPALPEIWSTPPLGAGWGNIAGLQRIQYRLTADNMVEIVGGAITTSATPNAVMFSLDANHSPVTDQRQLAAVERVSGGDIAHAVDIGIGGAFTILNVPTVSGRAVYVHSRFPKS